VKRRVVLADDSVVFRRFLYSLLAADPRVEVVGEAADGAQAIALTREKRPDVLTLDVDMPLVNGIEVLDALLKFDPRPAVIMVSRLTDADSRTTLAALCRGAADFVLKPVDLDRPDERALFGETLRTKIQALAGPVPDAEAPPAPRPIPAERRGAPPRAVLIGTSTGGPNALAVLLRGLRADFPLPLLIVQHMPPVFTGLLAERLSAESALSVREAREGAVPRPGEAWVAPGDRHLAVAGEGDRWFLHLTNDPPENYCRPSVDVLFRSAAKVWGGRALGLILTGMGQDGVRGCAALRRAGGAVLAQDAASSLIWGMPGSVVQAGLANDVLPLDRMAERLNLSTAAIPANKPNDPRGR
jgi:two-component system chemotaxis response regulator CheB